MSLICRVVIGYFDAQAACALRRVVATAPLDEARVARLQAACDELFRVELRLSEYLTRDGLLCIEAGVIRPDTYRAAAVAHGLFGLSAVDIAHRSVIFPAEDAPPLRRREWLSFYRCARPDMDKKQLIRDMEEGLRRVREEREFERAVRERVRSFAAARGGWDARPM
jgi:hypothetical protein